MKDLKYLHHVSVDDYNIKGDQSLILFKISSIIQYAVRCSTQLNRTPGPTARQVLYVRVNMMYTHHITLDRRMRRQC